MENPIKPASQHSPQDRSAPYSADSHLADSQLVAAEPQSHSKGFWLGALCTAALLFMIWVALIWGQLGTPMPGSLWVDQSYQQKKKLADAIQQPKLLVVAGSNALFGVNSAMLESFFDRPAVNFSVNAGLQLPLILQKAEEVISTGDLVIMPLEHTMYYYDGTLNHVEIDYLLSHKALFFSQPLFRQLKIIAQTGIKRIYEGYKGLPDNFVVSGLYGAHNIDQYGDQTNSEYAKRPQWITQIVLNHKAEQYGVEAQSRFDDAEGLQRLRDFVARMQQKGACVIFTPPAFMFHPDYKEIPEELNFYSTLADKVKQAGLDYLGQPYDFMYAPDHFFDTNFHLTDESRRMHTQKLIQLLDSAEAKQIFSPCRG